MPATVQSILKSVKQEWEYWGKSTWHVPKKVTNIAHRDDEAAFAQYVIDAYCSVGGGSPNLIDIQDDRFYWSAVGMSAFMKAAGYTRSEFPFSIRHSDFIRYFVKARKSGDTSAAFWGYRIGETGGQPEAGDIVAYARGKKMTKEKAVALFDSTASYESHSDVVIAKRAKEVDVVGANVLDSVTRKTLSINSDGHIVDDQHFWFAVLKRR